MPCISPQQLQELLERQFLAEIQLKKIQQAIQNLQKTYLQQKINMGNIAIGWNSLYSVPSKEKINSHAKDRLFSQSSSTSIANDANLAPFGQHRFKNLKNIRKTTKKRLKSTRKVKKITKY